MESQRRSENGNSVRPFFVAETQGQDRMARLTWLFERLQSYVNRWTGFATRMPISELVQSVFHTVLVEAVEIADNEQSALPGFPRFRQGWLTFAAIVRKINEHSPKETAEVLGSAFEDAQRQFKDELSGSC